jgi:hypothetical protein
MLDSGLHCPQTIERNFLEIQARLNALMRGRPKLFEAIGELHELIEYSHATTVRLREFLQQRLVK